MLAWKLAPGARDGQLRGAQAGRDHLDHRPQARGNPPGGGTAPGRGQLRHRSRRSTARPSSTTPRRPRSPSPARPRSGKDHAFATAGTGKKLTLELGGKAANIVFDDAPLDQAVEGIVNGIFFNQGHVCCAGSRLLVQEAVADTVMAKLKNRLRVLRVGDPIDKNTDIGAINSREQLDDPPDW
jgi:hypothetical protein